MFSKEKFKTREAKIARLHYIGYRYDRSQGIPFEVIDTDDMSEEAIDKLSTQLLGQVRFNFWWKIVTLFFVVLIVWFISYFI